MFDSQDGAGAPMTDTNDDVFGGTGEFASSGEGGNFADEVFSKKVATKMRTFYIDLKESRNGKFVKISEKSRGGQRSTIMFDGEDLDEIIAALQEVKSHV